MTRRNDTPQGRGSSDGAQRQAGSEGSIDDLSGTAKRIAMLLYNYGARTESETQRAFRAHPQWKAA